MSIPGRVSMPGRGRGSRVGTPGSPGLGDALARAWWRVGSAALVAAALAACGDRSGKVAEPPSPDLGLAPTAPSFGLTAPSNGLGQCMGDDAVANRDVISGMGTDPLSLNCTSNDVEIAFANVNEYYDPTANDGAGAWTPFDVNSPISCVEGQKVQLRMTAVLKQNANAERQDIGVWINADGKFVNGTTKAGYSGSCYHYNLVQGATGTVNGDNDRCAGMASGSGQVNVPLGDLEVTCAAQPTQSTLSIGSCVAWKVPGDDSFCPTGDSPTAPNFRRATLPTTQSKCNCQPFTVPIIVQKKATIKVDKICSPTNDAGTFDLNIDGATRANNAACGGTTGVVEVGAGTNVSPGATHAVSETDFNTAAYTSSYACTRNGSNTPFASGSGTSVPSFQVMPNDAVACTFTNTRKSTIIIVKDAQPNAAQDFAFTSTIPGEGNDAFSLDDDADATLVNSRTIGNVAPGSYTVTESAQAGWSLANLSCIDPTSNSTVNLGTRTATIDVAAGETVTCTYTNGASASLDVEKVTQGGTGEFGFTTGGDGLSGFTRTTTTAGTPTESAPFALSGADAVGDKYITESSLPTGWALTGIACSGATVAYGTGRGDAFAPGASAGFDQGDNTAKVTLAPGSAASCTFTNTRAATITVAKACVGGEGATFDFTGSGPGGALAPFTRACGASSSVVTTTSAFGAYAITESAGTGWELTNLVCTGDAGWSRNGATANIDLDAGESVTCTYTNTARASFDIEKQSVGGTATFDFTTSGTGLSAFTRNTAAANPTTSDAFTFTGAAASGDKYVSETAEPGYVLTSISCTANGATIAIGQGQNGTFTNGGSNGFDAGDNTVKITVNAGDAPTCTFVNTKQAQLTIRKETLPDGDATQFTFTPAGWNGGTGFALADGGSQASGLLAPGSYSVSETVPAGWQLTGRACVLTGTDTPKASNGTAPTLTVMLNAGEDVTCTFTNRKQATIVVEKETVGGVGTFAFAGGLGSFSLVTASGTNPASQSFANLTPGQAYTVTETVPAGWDLTGRTCTVSGGGTWQNANGSGISITPAAGATITCRFTNRLRASLTLAKRENGGLPLGRAWTFELRSGASQSAAGTTLALGAANITTGVVAFACASGVAASTCVNVGTPAVANVVPGGYQMCEVGMPAGYTNNFTGFTPLGSTAEGGDNSAECINVTLASGPNGPGGLMGVPNPIDNIQQPQGSWRTIGYWKNWSSCSGGRQYTNALSRGDWGKTLDGALAPTLSFPAAITFTGGVQNANSGISPDCGRARNILNKSTFTGTKRASDPAYNLAAQLLGAMLNVRAAGTCTAASAAITTGTTLLAGIGFNGTSAYTTAIQSAGQTSAFNAAAATLDSWNNNKTGFTCPAP